MSQMSMKIVELAVILLLCSLSEAEEQKCNSTILQCIKDINGGDYPINAWKSLGLLWNRQYSFVWFSEKLVKRDNLCCVKVVFGPFGAKDTYYHSCTDTEDIYFGTSFSIFDHSISITGYRGMNLKSYAVYYKKYCLALYVCSPDGVTMPRVAIYCPTRMLGNKQVKAEIEEAKKMFDKCNINDGTSLCEEECP